MRDRVASAGRLPRISRGRAPNGKRPGVDTGSDPFRFFHAVSVACESRGKLGSDIDGSGADGNRFVAQANGWESALCVRSVTVIRRFECSRMVYGQSLALLAGRSNS